MFTNMYHLPQRCWNIDIIKERIVSLHNVRNSPTERIIPQKSFRRELISLRILVFYSLPCLPNSWGKSTTNNILCPKKGRKGSSKGSIVLISETYILRQVRWSHWSNVYLDPSLRLLFFYGSNRPYSTEVVWFRILSSKTLLSHF